MVILNAGIFPKGCPIEGLTSEFWRLSNADQPGRQSLTDALFTPAAQIRSSRRPDGRDRIKKRARTGSWRSSLLRIESSNEPTRAGGGA